MRAIRSDVVAALPVLAILLLPRCGFAQDWEKVQVKAIPAGGGVYMLSGAGGNIGALAGDQGVLLIDTQFPQLHDKIVGALAGIGATGPVRLVLNTNWHFDHALGNELFRKSGAVIVAHANGATRMSREQTHAVLDEKTAAYPPAALPEITFADSLALRFGGDDIDVLHAAGAHSDADAFFVFRKANVIHTGDLFFSNGYPYIDIGNGGTVAGMIAAADRILALAGPETKLIPGHGPLSDRGRLQAFRAMLVTARDRVAQAIKEGKTLEQVTAAKPTADLDAAWQGAMPPDGFVALVYKDLARTIGG